MATSTNPRVKAYNMMLRNNYTNNVPSDFYFGKPTFEAGFQYKEKQ